MIDLENFPTNPVAKEILDMISPIYDRSYVGKWIFQVMGLGLGTAKERILSLYQEAFPGTAYLTLPLWEAQYGITPSPEMSLEARRMAIFERIQAKHPINPAWLASELNEACRREVEIIENTGDFHFTVKVSDGQLDVKFSELFDLTDQYKPAHLTYSFQHDVKMELGLTYGCVEREFKKLTSTETDVPDPLEGIGWYVNESDELLLDGDGSIFITEEVVS